MPPKRSATISKRTADPRYQKSVLENGIRVVSETIPYVRSVSLGVWADVGSRDELTDENGLSHFLEHMVFKGTRNRSTREIAQSLESLGGYLNAFTTKEQTCFYARVLDRHLPEAMDVLSDLVLNATFEKKELEKEKRVVIEELKNAEDDPEDIIHDYFENALFPKHPLGWPVIGTVKNVKRFTRNDLKTYLDRYYHPEQLVIAAAGNLSHKDLKAFVAKAFRSMKGGKPLRERKAAPLTEQRKGEVTTYRRPIQQAHLCMGTVGFSLSHQSRYALHLLNGILGEGMSSRLYQSVREKHGLAYSVYSFASMLTDTGTVGVYAGTDDANVDHAIGLIQKEINLLVKTRVRPDELHRTKSQLKGSLMLGLESMSNRMMRLGGGELHHEPYRTIDQILEKIDGVTARNVQEVAEQLFDRSGFSTVIIRPEEQQRA